MKTLTTLTAVVALVAGMSIANAADSSSMGKSSGAGPMTKSARVIGSSKYCVKTKTGTLNCKFASLSACKKGAKSASCVTNPHIGTTGSGAMSR